MGCLVCGKPSKYDFCVNHIPRYGRQIWLDNGRTVVFCGTVKIQWVVLARMFGARAVRWWWGTDALTLHAFPPGLSKIKITLHRIKVRLLDCLIGENWAFSSGLADEIKPFVRNKKIRVVIPPPDHISVKREPFGDVFVVGYYFPRTGNPEFVRWKYGLDLIWEAASILKSEEVRFLPFSGDHSEIAHALIGMDCYIRPARHDGTPRLVLACQELGIPYYYREDFNCSVEDVVKFIRDQARR